MASATGPSRVECFNDLPEVSFDPAYRTQPLERYEPLVRELFARTPRPFL